MSCKCDVLTAICVLCQQELLNRVIDECYDECYETKVDLIGPRVMSYNVDVK